MSAAIVQRDTESIRSLLTRFGRGYEQLDASAVAAIWPGVDQSALRRAFDALSSQQVLMEACRLTLAGAAATATCHGVLRVVRRVGGSATLTQPMQWTFKLARNGQDWTIASVRSTSPGATP